METPSVVHPTTFQIGGMHFQVVSYVSLSDKQAAKVAMHFYRTHKFKKKNKGKLFKVFTLIDSDSAKLW